MDYVEIENILKVILDEEVETFDKPTEAEWIELSSFLNCTFSKEFKYFIELMCKWSFPGDIYNVSKENTNGNDTIEGIYKHEMKIGNWKSNMIPFYGVGNGDYFCLNAIDRNQCKVYYYYQDRGSFEEYCRRFEDWIKGLPEFSS